MCQYTKEDEVGPKIEPRGQFEERFRDTVSRVQDCTVYETSPAEKCQSYLTGERRMAVPYVSTQGPPHKGSPIRDRPFPNTKIIGIIDKKSKYLPHELPPPKIPSPPHLLTTALRVPTHPPPQKDFFFREGACCSNHGANRARHTVWGHGPCTLSLCPNYLSARLSRSVPLTIPRHYSATSSRVPGLDNWACLG